jgi:hypothetical protein
MNNNLPYLVVDDKRNVYVPPSCIVNGLITVDIEVDE